MSKCKWCMDGSGAMILQPQNLLAPCLFCSPNKTLSGIEKELGGKFGKDTDGSWVLWVEEVKE